MLAQSTYPPQGMKNVVEIICGYLHVALKQSTAHQTPSYTVVVESELHGKQLFLINLQYDNWTEHVAAEVSQHSYLTTKGRSHDNH